MTEANCHELRSNSGSKTVYSGKIMSNSTMNMKNQTPLVTVPSRFSVRKHAFYGILALVSLLGLAMTQSARANLVTNPGLKRETSPAGQSLAPPILLWSPSPSTAFRRIRAVFRRPPAHGHGFLTQNLSTTPGASYVLDFWLAIVTGTSQRLISLLSLGMAARTLLA